MAKVNWAQAIKPLQKKYKGKKHPLEYKNIYQLVVMVVLSAQTNDKLVNDICPKLFSAVPNMKTLSNLSAEMLYPYISKITGFRKKADWLVRIAKELKNEKNIPFSIAELTKLPGIGRKSANVIMREAGKKPEGVIVDLHVIRVAPRLGIATGSDPKKIEAQIMQVIPQENWGVGMDFSYLGREICRPTKPDCSACPLNSFCKYYKSGQN